MADKSERALREEKILRFWEDNKIFQKTLEKESPEGEFVFYDGPPFATGLPHYGHILPGTIKDAIPRYKTMQGHRVPRRWGWDCHGLPIENLIEQELGLETKKDIEKYGIAEFNERAKASVLRYEKDWKEIIPRTGRWVDMDNPYKTMDRSYTESVWWSFKTLYDKGLVYKGFKSMHVCPRCGTPLSNFEVNQGYKDITDISVFAEFKLTNLQTSNLPTYLLAWTTTPWTLPGNVALAVNPEIEYAEVEGEVAGNTYILARSRVEEVFGENYKITKTFPGKELVGKKYKTIFDYYLKESRVYGADFVTAEEGTGVVHIAPAFGEDDYELSLREKLPFVQHVDTEGRFKPEVKDFAGEMVKPKDDPSNPSGQAHQATDIKIIKYLAANNSLFDKKKITHSYPHCWRCDTPLLNYATSSWFVKVTDIKEELIRNNKQVNWIPEDIRDGRFGKWLEGARDWAVSRSRFWGTPLPVWQNNDGSKVIVVDSFESLKKYAKGEVDSNLDLHRPHIDKVILEKDGEEYRRIEEVFDTWYDSGSVPFASRASRDLKQADFIAEGLDQTRGWFYTLLVLSTAIFGKSPYKNVAVNGLILAEDGKKMSKRLKNYPELTYVLDNYGADAMRYYLLSSPAVRAEDLAFSEKGLDEVAKKIITRLDNVVSFYELYAGENSAQSSSKKHVLDIWIETKLEKLIKEVTGSLDKYELDRASRPIADFVDDLSTWYLRRSRSRPEALLKLREVLLELSKVLAPFMPFLAEDIYQRLKDENSKESVHLESWPKAKSKGIFGIFKPDSDSVLKNMEEIRRLVSLALDERQKAGIKVRQPLGKLEVKSSKLGGEYLELIKDEVNVKEVVENKDLDVEVRLDTAMTPELEEEGKVRDMIREIQEWRKEQGLQPGQKAKYAIEQNKDLYLKHKEEIEEATQVELT